MGAVTEEASDVEVTLASVAERTLIEALFQFYSYDFSELEPADSDNFELSADGRFGDYPYLDGYWDEAGRAPFLIRRRGGLAGFALVNAVTHSGLPADRNMAEFFVMRKHRRRGVAKAAARAIFSSLPGRWEVAVAERNLAARAFWQAAVTATPGVRDLTIIEGDGINWTGPILRFAVQP